MVNISNKVDYSLGELNKINGVQEYVPEKDKQMIFMDITNQMFDTYCKKNADYGDSFSDMFDEFGLKSVIIRLSDKLNRVKTLEKNKEIFVLDEKIEDTLMDMANYAIMALIELKERKRD